MQAEIHRSFRCEGRYLEAADTSQEQMDVPCAESRHRLYVGVYIWCKIKTVSENYTKCGMMTLSKIDEI